MTRLIFSTTNGPYSRLIRFFTWSTYSHVSLILNDDTVLDSDIKGGVQKRSLPNLLKKSSAWEIVEVNSTSLKVNLEIFMSSQIGKGYDYTAIFGLVFRRDWQRPNKWFCSELIAWSLKGAGFNIGSTKTNRITPRDLYHILEGRMEIIAQK